MPHSGRLRTARALVFALALFILAAIAYLSNRNWQEYASTRAEGQTASQAVRVNERLLGLIRDVETGERGYLLTGRSDYLVPYHQALASIDDDLELLQGLLAKHPQQLERFANLKTLIIAKLEETKTTLDVRDTDGAAAALAVMEKGTGKQLMDGIRAVSQQIESGADEHLNQSRTNISRHTSQARLITLIGCSLLLVILVGAFIANERSSNHREDLIAELAGANRESAEVRDLLRTTLYSIGDGVVTTDCAGCVQLMNSMAERLTGFAESDARGKPIEEIFKAGAEDQRRIPVNAVRAVLSAMSASPTGAPVRMRGKGDTEIFVEASATPILDASGALRGAVLVLRDVSARVQSEERLRQAAKLESLGVLAGGIAHDFNNILVGIVGNASLLEDYFPPGAAGRELVDTLQSAGDRAARLTNQMLAYSGRGKFVVRELDLSHEVEEIASLVAAAIPKNVALRLSPARGLPPIDADGAQLQQLIMNLVINAAEAVGESSGYVEVSTFVQRVTDQPIIDVLGETLQPGCYVVLAVKDTGHGMDDATKARIFDPFFTTKFTGRGLGLAATLGIVKGHGGAIEVQSAPAQGALFRAYFPALNAANGARSGGLSSFSSAG